MKKNYLIVFFHYYVTNSYAICHKYNEYKFNFKVRRTLFPVKLKLPKFKYISRIMSSLQINFCNYFIQSCFSHTRYFQITKEK